MKKWLNSIASLILIIAVLTSLPACLHKDTPDAHSCTLSEYNFSLSEENHGNCQKVGYKVYTCECGFSYRVYNTEKGDHTYGTTKIIIVEATYSSEGMKAYRCTVPGCGAHDPDSEEIIPKKTTTFPPISGGS